MDGGLECTKDKVVSIGFHAFTNEESIKLTCKVFPETKMTKHWAIIPKGSKYFLGKDGNEIVSNKLIIFRTREDFREYRRNQK